MTLGFPTINGQELCWENCSTYKAESPVPTSDKVQKDIGKKKSPKGKTQGPWRSTGREAPLRKSPWSCSGNRTFFIVWLRGPRTSAQFNIRIANGHVFPILLLLMSAFIKSILTLLYHWIVCVCLERWGRGLWIKRSCTWIYCRGFLHIIL